MGVCREMFRPRTPASRNTIQVGLRKLYLIDLICDAVSGPLGLGVFVLLGYVARMLAGPSVILSVTYVAIVAAIAGFCYAELEATNPKTGSSANLSLNLGGVGEFIAFLVSWNLIADLAIGAAIASRGVRSSIDILTNNSLSEYFKEVAPLESEYTSEFVDFVALCIPLVACLICFALREYMLVKVVGTIFSFLVFLFMIIAGIFKADSSNWSLPPSDPPRPEIGEGYFLPFGMQGTFQGACALAVAFANIDKGAYPSRYTEGNKPLAVTIGLISTYFFLFFIGLLVTMMLPYYDLIEGQEIVGAFRVLTYPEGLWIVAIPSVMVLLYSVETLIYTIITELNSLVNEHLVFSFIGSVDVLGRKRPFFGIIVVGIAAGLMGAFFKEEQLAHAISIGTLISFGIVSCSSIIQRCQYEPHDMEPCSFGQILKQFLMCRKLEEPDYTTASCVKIATALFGLMSLALGGLIVHFGKEIESGDVWAVVTLIVLAILALYTFSIITLQPQIKRVVNFQLPLFPFFNGLGIIFTAFLLMNMSHTAWYRLAIWSAVGFIIYGINLCVRPPMHTNLNIKSGSNSVLSLVQNQSNHSTHSGYKGGIQLIGNSVAVRDNEWKPEDTRRHGWILKEEEENNVEILDGDDKLSFGTNSDITAIERMEEKFAHNIAIPEIIITAISNPVTPTTPATPGEDQDTAEFYAKQLDAIFTFDVGGDDEDAESTSSAETVVQVHVTPQGPSRVVDEDTGEVSRPNVRFADLTSSDDDGVDDVEVAEQDSDVEEVIVTPSSPAPPPLPPASMLISEHLSARSRVVLVKDTPLASSIPEEAEEEKKEKESSRPSSHLSDFQLELRNTLKLRSQKMIDSIENTVVNVNEGIEIFGGRRSRTASIGPEADVPTIKPGGKFDNHAFVEKLDSILKDRLSEVEVRPRAKVYKQKRVVVEDLGSLKPAVQMRLSTEELMSAKQKLRSSSGENSSLAGEINNNINSAPAPAPSVQIKPQPAKREAKSLDALSNNVEIIMS